MYQGNLEASTSGFQNRPDLCQRLAGGRTLHSQRLVNTKSSLEIKFQPRNEPKHPCLRDPPRPLTLARAGNFPTREVSQGGGVFYQALLLVALWWGTSSVHRCFFYFPWEIICALRMSVCLSVCLFLTTCPSAQDVLQDSMFFCCLWP